MDKKVYYINMHNNINKLAAYNINIEGDYLCPLCLKAYKEQDVRNVLTEEDVPQHSLGGKRIVYLQPIITQYFASNKSEIWS